MGAHFLANFKHFSIGFRVGFLKLPSEYHNSNQIESDFAKKEQLI
jgi:hypothetical protein